MVGLTDFDQENAISIMDAESGLCGGGSREITCGHGVGIIRGS